MNRSTTPVPGLLRRVLGRRGERQRGFAEAGVAVTGAALVLGAALGSGVASTVVSMSDGVTWLPDEETGQVVQVNPATGRAERRLQVAEPGSGLGISQRDGHLVVTDEGTGTVTSIDLATLLAGGRRRTDEPARVLVGGGRMYLVTVATGVVRAVDPLTLRDLGSPYRVGTALADAVVDERGAVWLVTTAGDVRSVSWLPDARRFDAGEARPVRGAGAGTRLLPHARGVTVFAPDGGAVLQVGVGRDVAVAVPALEGEVLPAESAPDDLAPAGLPQRGTVVMLAGDRLLEVGVRELGCERPGRPAVFGGLVYVPCTGAGRVLVLTPDGTRARPDVVVPAGRDPRLLVDDGRLLVHTEDGARAVVVEADGSTRVIDTGRGAAAVHDPRDGGASSVAVPAPHRPPSGRQDAPGAPGGPGGPWQGGPGQGGPWQGDPGQAAPAGDAAVPGPRDVTDPEARPGATPGPTADPGADPDPDPGTGPGTDTDTGTDPDPDTGPAPGPTATARPVTPPAAAPDAPTGVVATVGEPLSDRVDVTVTWRGVSPRPEEYVVRPVGPEPTGPDVLGRPAPVRAAGSASAATLSVWCGTRYTFTVEAVDGGVASAPAASASVRTPGCVGPEPLPSAPTGVTATSHPDGTVTVSWASQDTTYLDGFLVGPVGGSTTSTDETATSVVLRDVPPGPAVRFVVQAVRGAQSAASAPSAAVAVAGPPGAVTDLTLRDRATTGETHDLTMAWGAAPDNGSPVVGYDVTWAGTGAIGGFGGRNTVTGLTADIHLVCDRVSTCDRDEVLTVTVTPRNAVGSGPTSTYPVSIAAYERVPTAGEPVVGSVGAAVPALDDPEVHVTVTLTPPQWWADHAGGCTLLVTHSVEGASDRAVPCTGGSFEVGGFDGGTLTVAVRAENVRGGGVTSGAEVYDVPPRDNWVYCEQAGTACTAVAGLTDPDVAVVPVPWSPGLPAGSQRPPVAATGLGLLLAAGVLRAARRRGLGAAAVAASSGSIP